MIDDDLKVRRLEGELERLSERLADALRRLDELERAKGASVLASGTVSEDEDGIEPQIEAPDSVNATLEKSFLAPDEIVTDLGSPKRKSISFLPETDGGVQIHEFDDAPSAGVLKVVKRGSAWVLVDPDERTGNRKWMIPLRREDGDIEVKWVMIGEDDSASDSSSQSASASQSQSASESGPCNPEILIEEVSGTTGHPNGGYKITVTHADCTRDEYYIWNGDDGQDGCSPTVSAAAQSADGRTEAGTITDCNGNTITVYNGKNGNDGNNGVGIASVAKTSTSGLVDTYTITLTNGNTYTFTVTNGRDGSDCSASGGASMTCCEVKKCLAGLPAPHAISMSGNTVTIQPRKYKVSSGSDCVETENDGAAITFTIPTLPSHVPVTVLTDWTVSGTTVVTKKREINVVNPGNEQTTTIQGRSCEEAAEGGD